MHADSCTFLIVACDIQSAEQISNTWSLHCNVINVLLFPWICKNLLFTGLSMLNTDELHC